MNINKKILIYHVGSIGDTIVALPAFKTLKHNLKKDMDLLNLSVVRNMVHTNLYTNDNIFSKKIFLLPPQSFPGKIFLYWQFFKACILNKYSELYCFSPEIPKVLAIFFKLFCSNKIKHCFSGIDRMDNIPIWQDYLNNLKKFGITDVAENAFDFPLSQEDIETARKTAEKFDKNLVAFGIGGNQNVCQWGIDNYSALLNILLEKYDFIPVYIGGEKDRANAEKLQAKHGGFFLGDTDCKSLNSTIAFLKHCKCYIGNDCGSMHLAAAASVPCAVIMSAHNLPEKMWYPYGNNNIVFRTNIECAGCHLRICPKGACAPCIEKIKVEYVSEKIGRLF